MPVICASGGITSRMTFSASSGVASRDGSGRTTIRRRSCWAICRTRSLDSAKTSMFFVYITIVGPSKSTCVISTWSGTTFFTTLRASFRMSSMVIGHHFGRSRLRDSGQFHTCLALLDFLVVEHFESVFRDEGHVDSFAGDGVAFHGSRHGADREVRALVERHVVLEMVFEHTVHVRAPGATRHELVRQGSAGRIEGEDVSAGAVPAADHELDPVRIEAASAQDVRRQRGAGLDRHRDASLQLVQFDLGGDVPREDLQVSHETRGRQADVIIEPIDLFRSLVGDQRAGRRAAVRGEDHAILADETQRGGAGLDFSGTRCHSYTPVQKGVKNDSRSIRPALFKNFWFYLEIEIKRNSRWRGRSHSRATRPKDRRGSDGTGSFTSGSRSTRPRR